MNINSKPLRMTHAVLSAAGVTAISLALSFSSPVNAGPTATCVDVAGVGSLESGAGFSTTCDSATAFGALFLTTDFKGE